MEVPAPNTATTPLFQRFGRPAFQLRSLPVRYRWEVTRRHPFYQVFWQQAAAFYRGDPADDPLASVIRTAAVVVLGQIGVSGESPDPKLQLTELEGGSLNPAWLTGAVQPLTFRAMAGQLMAYLPKDTLSFLGMTLIEASLDDKDGQPPAKFKALLELGQSDAAGLNDYPDEPFVSINPAASGRQLSEALERLLSQWKEERDLEERRSRADKYDDYLAVWDLREGWSAGHYDRAQEHTLLQIAQQRAEPVSTVNHHYRAAFGMITGHDYSPDAWLQIMGSRIVGTAQATARRRRPKSSPTIRLVPETTLQSDPTTPPAFMTRQKPAPPIDVDLLIDLKDLLQQGRSPQQISEALEIPEEMVPDRRGSPLAWRPRL